jgi:hypothetical protein
MHEFKIVLSVFKIISSVMFKSATPIKHWMLTSLYSLLPYFWTWMSEKLQELRDENIKRTIESITVQQLSRVLTDLLECSKWTLKWEQKLSAAHMHRSVQKYHYKQDRVKGATLKYCSGSAMLMIVTKGKKTGIWFRITITSERIDPLGSIKRTEFLDSLLRNDCVPST